MKTYRLLPYLTLLFAISPIRADLIKQFRDSVSADLNKFRKNKFDELENFRRSINEDIALSMSKPWISIKITPKIDIPIDPSPEPIHINMDTVKRKIPKPVIIKEIITRPKPTPQPDPIEPIIEIKQEPLDSRHVSPESIDRKPLENKVIAQKPVTPTSEDQIIEISPKITDRFLDIIFYGTKFTVRLPDLTNYRLKGNNSSSYADAWRTLNNTSTNNLILDCLALRDDKALCDWAYLQFIQLISQKLCPDNHAKATLLSGFLLSQCGYKIRFATDSQNCIHLLYSPSGTVFMVPSFNLDGCQYYIADEFDSNDLNYRICNFKCPGEKQLSFEINRTIKLDYEPSQPRIIKIHDHPDIEISVTINRNLIDFYGAYPVATIGNNIYTQWAIYANAPASPEIQRDLYPILKEKLNGKTQKDAANLLMHLVESFPYGYDNQIWGYERAFFMDESWYYPLSDCEDHAIHFTRLARDILGLEAILVCYPEHMASAVAFTDPDIEGDYVIHNGKKFIICDPTIFYANIGITMHGCDNTEAVLIDLGSIHQ